MAFMPDRPPWPEGRLAIVTSVVGKSTEISQRRHINELFGVNTAVIAYCAQPGFTTDKPFLHITLRPPRLGSNPRVGSVPSRGRLAPDEPLRLRYGGFRRT